MCAADKPLPRSMNVLTTRAHAANISTNGPEQNDTLRSKGVYCEPASGSSRIGASTWIFTCRTFDIVIFIFQTETNQRIISLFIEEFYERIISKAKSVEETSVNVRLARLSQALIHSHPVGGLLRIFRGFTTFCPHTVNDFIEQFLDLVVKHGCPFGNN